MKRTSIYQLLSSKGLLLIMLLALIIRIGFFVSLHPWDNAVVIKNILVDDAVEYHHFALSLISDKSFEAFDGYRTPGYPVFIALLYSISSASVWFVLFIQLILNLISGLLVYKIAGTIFPRTVALLSVLLFAVDLNQAECAMMLYSDTLFVFLFLAAIYYLIKGIKEDKNYKLGLSALIIGIATLVRPVSYLFPVVFIIFMLTSGNLTLKVKWVSVSVFVLIFLLTISPWLLHNYVKYGEAKLTTQSGSNLLFCNVVSAEVYKTGRPAEEVSAKFEKLAEAKGVHTTVKNPFKISEIYSDIAEKYIRENFILYSERHLMGIVNLYANLSTKHIASIFHLESTSIPYNYFAGPFLYTQIVRFFHSKTAGELTIAFFLSMYLLINYSFTFYTFFSSIRSKENFVYLFFLIILYFSVITGVIGLARLRIPFMPFINILCAFGFYRIYHSISDKLTFSRRKKNHIPTDRKPGF